MNTHAFIVYGKIAEQIKSVYPFCAYYFILSSNKNRKLMAQTVYRQAKAFDRVYLDGRIRKIKFGKISGHIWSTCGIEQAFWGIRFTKKGRNGS